MAQSGKTELPPSIDSGLEAGPFRAGFFEVNSGFESTDIVRMPRRLNMWARVATLIFFIITLIVVFVPWTQTISVEGQLSSYFPIQRPQKIQAQIKGRIQKWQVNEGDRVKKGQLILTLEDIDPKFLAPDLMQRLDQSRQALENQRDAARQKAGILTQRLEKMKTLVEAAISEAEAKIFEAENKVLNLEQRIPPARVAKETALLNLNRSRTLEEKGLLSRRKLELAIRKARETEADVEMAKASLQEARQALAGLQHKRRKIDAELVQKFLEMESTRASALSDAAKASKDIADLELKRSTALRRQQGGKITAPFGGTVVRLAQIGPGQIVHMGDMLFTLAPENATPAVEMWASSIDAPLLKAGRPVRILFQGVPAVPIPAWPELMAGTFEGQIRVVDQTASPNGKFRFWVVPESHNRPWPPQSQVRPGTQVRGWVMLNRVPLWYELWRRFNLFPPDYQSADVPLMDILIPKAGRPRK